MNEVKQQEQDTLVEDKTNDVIKLNKPKLDANDYNGVIGGEQGKLNPDTINKAVELIKLKKPRNYKKKPNGKNAVGTLDIEYRDSYPEEILKRFKDIKEQVFYQFSYRRPSEHQESVHYELHGDTKELVGPLKSKDPKIIRQMFPTFQRRATDHNVTSKTLISRCTEHPLFGQSHSLCKEIQEAIAQEGVMLGIFNAAFTMFMLKNNHGRRDEQHLLGDKDQPIGVIVLPQRRTDGSRDTTK